MDVSQIARRHRVVVPAIFAVVCLAAGCSQDSSNSQWEFDEDIRWQVDNLHGPLEAPNGKYRGRIGEELYFEQNFSWSVSPKNAVVAYTPSSGWKPAPDLILQAVHGDPTHNQEIIEAEGFSFILDREASVLHRSADGGQSWQELSGPQPVRWGPLRTDGEHLFIPEHSSDVGGFDPARLWRSSDFGESWEVVLDDIESYNLRVADGVVTAVVVVPREGDTFMRSTDGGDSWQRIGTVYELDSPYDRLGAREWTSFGGQFVTPPDSPRDYLGATIGVIGEDGLASFHRVEGLESTEWVRHLAPCGGELFATAYETTDDGSSNVGRLGKLDGSLTRWTEIDLPPKTHVRDVIGESSLYCIGDESLILMASAGVLRSDDQGATWRQVGSPFTSPDFAFEWDGRLHSGERFAPMWTLGDDQSWTPAQLVPDLDPVHTLASQGGITDIEKVGERLYVTVDADSGRAVYRLDEPGAEPQQLWSAEFDNNYGRNTILDVDGDRIVVTSSRAPYKMLVSQDGGESFQRMEVPENEYPNVSVESVTFHADTLWAVTNDRTVWKIDLDEMSWENTADTFPADMPDHQTPNTLRSVGGELLAFWSERVYRRIDGRWKPLITDELRAALGMPPLESFYLDGPDIVDVTADGDTALVATETHIVFLNLDDGRYRLFEPDVDLPMTRLFNLDSGLYVGFDNGGLRRLEQSP